MTADRLPVMDQTDLRVFVAVQTLGLCAAMDAGAMDPGDAARWLFRPEVRATLESVGACRGCIGLVEMGEDALLQEGAVEKLRQHAFTLLTYSQA